MERGQRCDRVPWVNGACLEPDRTRKDPNMAMEERKCQISWSSKNESRMQSLLCSRDSAGVF